MNDKLKRVAWVDMAKGIAILAVVLGHINYEYPTNDLVPIRMLLYGLWHVSVFYVIGGFFINESKLEKPTSFIVGKIKSLYLLILYIYIPYVLLHNVFIDIGFYDIDVDYFGKSVSYWTIGDFIKNIVLAILFAGREPLLGPMWFVYVLFMALCVLSILSWGLRKLYDSSLIRNKETYEIVRFSFILFLTLLSYAMTNFLHLNIPRFNNVFTAVWFIYVGMLLMKRIHIKFDNGYIAIISAFIVYHIATMTSGIAFNSNKYDDLASFTISTLCCTYIICYVCKQIESYSFSNILSYIGNNSFYIMGLQFTGFRCCTFVLNCFGYDYNMGELTTPQISSLPLLLLYMFFGVVVPLCIIGSVRFLKRHLLLARASQDLV